MPAPARLKSQRLQRIADLSQRASREERREQLIKVAAWVVDFEGIDAVKHVRIAELAGCGRPLVYSYFPRKCDIYIAISESFYERLEQHFSCEEQFRAVRESLTGNAAPMAELESLIWDVLDEFGTAGLILRCVPELNEDFRLYHQELKAKHEYRWLRYFVELGLDELSAGLLLDNCIAITKNIAVAYHRGKLARKEALRRTLGSMGRLIQSEVKRVEKSRERL